MAIIPIRGTYKLTQEQYDKIMDACKSVPLVAIHCGPTPTPQERANRAWCSLGDELGFDGMTVQPVHGNNLSFTAIEKGGA